MGHVYVFRTLMDYWVLPRRARDRGKKLRYLQRISEEWDILCLQETHGRIEHLAIWFKNLVFSHLVTSLLEGLSFWRVLTYSALELLLNTKLSSLDETLIRIRFHDCSCAIINMRYQPELIVQDLRQRLRAAAALWPTHPGGIGAGDFNICDQLRAASILVPRLSATTMSAVLLPALPPSLAPSRLPSPLFTRKDVRRDGSIHTLSRKDRIFVNLPMTELRDFSAIPTL